VAGKSYVNSKGDIVDERKIGEDCRCRRKCYTLVTEEERHKLFMGYYSLNSHDEQNAYLFGLIRKTEIARKRSKESDRRTCSYKYFVRTQGKEVQICRLAFAHIHGISPHKIRILCQKQDQNIMFPRDGRGKHDNRPRKVSSETLTQIKDHIYSIIRSDRVCVLVISYQFLFSLFMQCLFLFMYCVSGERFLERRKTQWTRFKHNKNVERLLGTV